MRIFRRHIALLFLFCTLIVQTPRSWLHDCHDTEFATHHQDIPSLEEDCQVCDQPALLSEESPIREISEIVTFTIIPFSLQHYAASVADKALINNKAPPVLPC
jgi:hypothetical protein